MDRDSRRRTRCGVRDLGRCHDALAYLRTKSCSANVLVCCRPLSSRPKNVHRRGVVCGSLIILTVRRVWVGSSVPMMSPTRNCDGWTSGASHQFCVPVHPSSRCCTTLPATRRCAVRRGPGTLRCAYGLSLVTSSPTGHRWRSVNCELFRCQRWSTTRLARNDTYGQCDSSLASRARGSRMPTVEEPHEMCRLSYRQTTRHSESGLRARVRRCD